MFMKVAVIGVGLTNFDEHWDQNLRQLAIEAGTKAILDANVRGRDIDAIYLGNMSAGRFIGQEHVAALVSGELGLSIPAVRVEGACASGGLALRQGLFSILSGEYNIVLVGGAEKMTDLMTESVTSSLMGAADQEWEAYYGVTFPSLYAMIARRHMFEFGTTREQMAKVAVKNHHNGSMNPIAQFKDEITIDQVLNSTMVADPLTLFDCSPITDGAATLILCKAELAKKYTDNPVYIIGSGQASDTLALHDRRSLTTLDATVKAAQNAYKQAGITANDVSFAEVHDCFTIAEIVATEDLGFCKKGEGGKLLDERITEIGGRIPVNTSGGLKAVGHPVGATGIKQAVEAVLQLRGQAGKRQVNDAKIGLTHNVGGSGATAVVHIFSR
jgi:acetyl-CoA C-acetyltransferase